MAYVDHLRLSGLKSELVNFVVLDVGSRISACLRNLLATTFDSR
jgi:hypothetical protein